MPTKSFDEKLKALAAEPAANHFILADAKDADMAFGMAAPGVRAEGDGGHFRSLQDYRQHMRENTRQGLVDIMLMSASSCELLVQKEQLFAGSPVTPAFRANDSTDIWNVADSQYRRQPARPFCSASLRQALGMPVEYNGKLRRDGTDLALYSITFNNEVELDRETLTAYGEFREQAASLGLRHFLEVFDPNAPQAPIEDLGRFMNDNIARTLAGVAGPERPLFLKVAYHGPAAMEQLASYDASLVIGILGGSAGTTFDAFQQLWEARKYGARAALYGRMINSAEHQPTFIQHLRWIADGELDDPAEAVRSYHAALDKLALRPHRDLEHDLQAAIVR